MLTLMIARRWGGGAKRDKILAVKEATDRDEKEQAIKAYAPPSWYRRESYRPNSFLRGLAASLYPRLHRRMAACPA